MRVLVDESLPRQLAAEIPGHDVSSTRSQGWTGLRNGVLLRAAVDAGFQVMLTADRSVEFQQNLQNLGIAVIIILGRNRIADIRPRIPMIVAAIEMVRMGQVARVAG